MADNKRKRCGVFLVCTVSFRRLTRWLASMLALTLVYKKNRWSRGPKVPRTCFGQVSRGQHIECQGPVPGTPDLAYTTT